MTLSVLGGGIGGLSTLYYLSLRQNVPRTKLYEASSRFGGWVRSSVDAKTGVVFETGPRSLRPVGAVGLTTLELIEKLGIDEKVVPVHRSHIAAKNRMIYAKNRVCMMPNGPAGIFKTIPPFSKPLLFAGIKDLFTGKSAVPLEDESIYDFVARRFGQEVADYAISPVICGICAGDAKDISVKFLFKDIFEKEQKYGGVIRGAIKGRKDAKVEVPMDQTNFMRRAKIEGWSMYRMQDGIEAIPRGIIEALDGCENIEMEANQKCEKIEFSGTEVKMTVNGTAVPTQHVISTIPSFALAKIIQGHPILTQELSSIPYVDVAVINLLYKKENLLKEQGFGVLVAPSENLPILGVIFDSCIVDSNQNTVLTVMSGGKWFEKHYGMNSTKEQLLSGALDGVAKILDIHEKPDVAEVHLNRQCIPQYVVGHHQRVERIRSYVKDKKLPLSLGGAAFDGVGVNDVIMSAKNIANGVVF